MRKPEIYLNRPVRSLQTMLQTISAVDPRILQVIPDGFYGPQTTAAVRSFQYAYQLPATGIADPGTWAAISHTFQRSAAVLDNPILAPVWNAGQQVLPGQFNYHLYHVQGQLMALSDFFEELTPSMPTGRNDHATSENLKIIQRLGGLPQNGVLDSQTMHHLNGLYRTIVSDGFRR